MRVCNLFSGSSGNCTLVRNGERGILIDAGGSCRAIERGLAAAGFAIDGIEGIFVTHEHCDHTHGLPVLTKKYHIPVHITERSADALGADLGDCLVSHPEEFAAEAAGMRVEAFSTPHDSVCCVGYRVSDGVSSVGIVTDIGYVTQRVYDMLYGCDGVLLEANHDPGMVKNGSYPPALQQRILSDGGHLSNPACAEFAAALARSGTGAFLLVHLSRENNTPERAYETVAKALSPYGASLAVACRDSVTELLLSPAIAESARSLS